MAQEAKIAQATAGRVLRFDPSGGKLVGVETREAFPLDPDITISLVVAIRADSPDKGQAVVFWEDSGDRGQPVPAQYPPGRRPARLHAVGHF